MPKSLTLRRGALPADFRAISWNDAWEARAEAARLDFRLQLRHRVRHLVQAAQAAASGKDELVKAKASAELNQSEDYAVYLAHRERTEWEPWLRVGWAGSQPLTDEDLADSTEEEVHECLMAFMDVNPQRVPEMPPLIVYRYNERKREFERRAAERASRGDLEDVVVPN